MNKIAMHGWLILDKPLNIGSTDCVNRVKRIVKPTKIGHGGTLDPLASGILPLALGEATKTFHYMINARKTYEFEITWGEKRNTDDAEGEAIASNDVRPEATAIMEVLPYFIGEIEQIPPIFSAIKVKGERAYAKARAGEDVVLEPRKVMIHHLAYLGGDQTTARLSVECGKGTYVRALARDLAERLGAYGYVSRLRRTKVGNFTEQDAISLDSIEDLVHSGALLAALKPLQSALVDIPAIEVEPEISSRLRHGQKARIPRSKWTGNEQDTVCITQKGNVVALAELAGGLIRPIRIFNVT